MTEYLKYDKRKTPGVKSKMTAHEFKKAVAKEDHLQTQCEELLKIKGIKYIHIPDLMWKILTSPYYADKIETKTKHILRSILSKMFKGLPDLLIFLPGPGLYNFVWCVELKSKTGKTTQGQKNFSKRLNMSVIRDFENFALELKKFERHIETPKNKESR